MRLKYLFRKPGRRGRSNLMEQAKALGIDLAADDPFLDAPYEEDIYDRKCYSYTNKGERHYEGFTESDSYLISYTGDDPHVVIREGITVIGDTAFAKNRKILSVHLPESLRSIEYEAFRECENLEGISIPEDVEVIDEGAFKGCTGIEEIKIPPHVKKIGKYAFMGCAGIYEIEIPESIEKLGSAAFWGCRGLLQARLPESLRVIPGLLFYGCENLGRVTISSKTTEIGPFCFHSCVSLTKINIPESASIEIGAFCDCYNMVDENGMIVRNDNFIFSSAFVDSVEIPKGVKVLNAEAFRRCTDLESLSIPDSVKEVKGASGCMYVGAAKLEVGDIVSRYPFLFGANDIEEIVLSEKTTGLAEGVFASNNMEEIVIPAGVKFIGRWAFDFCTNLKKVVFKGDAPEIDKEAFEAVNAVMYYPEGNRTWNRKVFGSYGGCLTWKAYKEGEV